MLDESQHLLLHDVCLLWLWLEPKLTHSFSGEIVDKHRELFMKGLLGTGKSFGWRQIGIPDCDWLASAKSKLDLAGAKSICQIVIGTQKTPSHLMKSGWLAPNR